MCKKCNDINCLIGEKCGNLENTNMLIEDGTMAAFNLKPFDEKVEVKQDKNK